MKHIIILLTTLLTFNGFSQKPDDIIDPNNFNDELASKLFIELLDHHRDSLNKVGYKGVSDRQVFKIEPWGVRMAQHHTTYMSLTGKIEHNETINIPNFDNMSTSERKTGGETCGAIWLPSYKTYKKLVKDMFKYYKNSEPHYNLLIDNNYNYIGSSFKLGVKNFIYNTTNLNSIEYRHIRDWNGNIIIESESERIAESMPDEYDIHLTGKELNKFFDSLDE